MLNREAKERTIEAHLSKYRTYQIGLKNCQKQLDYMLPSVTANYDSNGKVSTFTISNSTEKYALDRITSKQALDLLDEIAQFKLILECINSAVADLTPEEQIYVQLKYFDDKKLYEIKSIMSYSQDKAIYRIRRKVMDKFLISLNNLTGLK